MEIDYKQGDLVEVWSNSRKEWIHNGTVEQVVLETKQIEDGGTTYTVPAGAVKVSSGAGTKWILPDRVPHEIRKPGTAPGTPAPRPDERSHSLGGGCKWGCGRKVQPGLTKGMNRYDTCCKTCGVTKGSGGHDANCQGSAPLSTAVKAHGTSPKAWYASMLSDKPKLEAHVQQVLRTVSPEGGPLTQTQVQEAIGKLLMQEISGPIEVSEALAADLMKQCGASDGRLDAAGFQQLCQMVIARRQQEQFPRKLATKASVFVQKNPDPVRTVYEFGKMLGEGSFGKVYSVTHKVSGEVRVCKIISKTTASMDMSEILAEIQSMAMLDHPNVIKIYEYFEDREFVSQIMEPCKGGELQDKIDEVFKKGGKAYDEAFMCDVMKQTLRALAFMHSERFMHKDLKPQNIMLADKESAFIKVIDFGLAEMFKPAQDVSDNFGGTLLYMAPEVFRQELGFKVDIWSLGVILYNLITGDYPFLATWPLPPGKDMNWWQEEVMRQIAADPYKPNDKLKTVSSECLDLLDKMLEKDDKKRLDAAGCLQHPWFRKFDEDTPTLSVGVTQCLGAYASCSELRKALFLLMAHECTPKALQELRAVFTHFDVTNRGTLSQENLMKVFLRSGMDLAKAERIIYSLDKDDSGAVDWTEFLAGALCISNCNNDRLIESAYSRIDVDHMNFFTIKDLNALLAQGDIKEAAKAIIAHEFPKISEDGSDKVTKEQFKKFMKKPLQVTGGNLLSAVS
mmetsp:Transcript_32031/g.70006  ORF Transcript_32031/g.70006 Transcript_32031/m.70006 type:complete len:735 (+) Transcript_32031:42-2246(+)